MLDLRIVYTLFLKQNRDLAKPENCRRTKLWQKRHHLRGRHLIWYHCIWACTIIECAFLDFPCIVSDCEYESRLTKTPGKACGFGGGGGPPKKSRKQPPNSEKQKVWTPCVFPIKYYVKASKSSKGWLSDTEWKKRHLLFLEVVLALVLDSATKN